MEAIKNLKAARLHNAMRGLIAAHEAIAEGIATHAEKHEAEIDARRKKVSLDGAIDRGIAATRKSQ